MAVLEIIEKIFVMATSVVLSVCGILGLTTWRRQRRFSDRADTIIRSLRAAQGVKSLVEKAQGLRISLGEVGAFGETQEKRYLRDTETFAWGSREEDNLRDSIVEAEIFLDERTVEMSWELWRKQVMYFSKLRMLTDERATDRERLEEELDNAAKQVNDCFIDMKDHLKATYRFPS